jgi:hypothetical protein
MGASVTLTASGHTPFTAASVGKQYLLRSGTDKVRVTVTAYTSTAVVTATLDNNAVASLQNTNTYDWALLATTFTGGDHLEAKTVQILGDGNVFPEAVMTNGSVTISQPVSKATIGLGFICDIETLNPDSAATTIQGKEKRIGKVVLKVENTRGLKVGPNSSLLREIKERRNELYGEPIAPITGDEDVLIDPSWNSNGRVFVRQENPLPATLLAIIPRIDIGG